ncbi:hypothetical protein C8Q80DRAFT_1272755 [Daedaleopsis nitida]|nr:hypothetical protein C8Q80DRAFT_1272755 [Daedaleopsis nitida]
MAYLHAGHSLAVMERKQFSSVGTEVLSSVIHLLGVSVLSSMLSMKVDFSEIGSWHLTAVSWPRLLVILNIADSWAFIFTTGILVHGTGMELSGTVCMMGILNCIIFYVSSKIIIYLFLAEKVYVVWHGHTSRFRSKIYLACLGTIIIYLGVVVFLIYGRVAFFRQDGACVIGLTRAASLTLLIYDLCINIVLTSLFVWPLLDRHFRTSLKDVAIRTLWAAAVALTTSCVNILVLTIMHGQQLAWVCLASCGTDVVVNAAVLCWVTSPRYEHTSEHSLGPTHTTDPATPGAGKSFQVGHNNVVLYSTGAPGEESASPHRSRFLGRLSRAGSGAARPSTGFQLGKSADMVTSRSLPASPRGYAHTKRARGARGAHTHTPAHSHSFVCTEITTMHDDSVELVSVGKIFETDAEDEESQAEGKERALLDLAHRERAFSSPAHPDKDRVGALIRTPARAHASTVKRSNTLLNRQAASSHEMQIVVTKETSVLTDDMSSLASKGLTNQHSPSPPPSPLPPSSDERWQ